MCMTTFEISFSGYNGTGVNCNNINECEIVGGESEPRHRCDSYANCTDTEGSFDCTCRDGFSGDGITCTGKHCKLCVIFTFQEITEKCRTRNPKLLS